MSQAWATDFIRNILQDHHIVFVGYTADDPPVQYLLEAFYHSKPTFGQMYVFHPGSQDDGLAKWSHRGVKPIVYSDTDYHKSLWDTLEAWQKWALAPTQWMKDIIAQFAADPRVLKPHQRGQITYIVETAKGAALFSVTKPTPSAYWLHVFDFKCRFATPKFTTNNDELQLRVYKKH